MHCKQFAGIVRARTALDDVYLKRLAAVKNSRIQNGTADRVLVDELVSVVEARASLDAIIQSIYAKRYHW